MTEVEYILLILHIIKHHSYTEVSILSLLSRRVEELGLIMVKTKVFLNLSFSHEVLIVALFP